MTRRITRNRAIEPMAIGNNGSREWWKDPAWLTLLGLGASMLTWLLHYLLVERPNVEQTQRDLSSYDQKLADLAANTTNLRQQARLAAATADDLQDALRKRTSEIELKTAELQRAKAADELLDSATPDIRFEQPPGAMAVELDGKIVIPMTIKNAGSRSAIITRARIDAKITPAPGATRPAFKIEQCQIGYIAPGNWAPCHFILHAGEDLDDIERIDYTYSVDAYPYMIEQSQSFQLLSDLYPPDVMKARLHRHVTFQGLHISE